MVHVRLMGADPTRCPGQAAGLAGVAGVSSMRIMQGMICCSARHAGVSSLGENHRPQSRLAD